MPTNDFTHLHTHSHYSLLDGLDSPMTLVKAAKDMGHGAISITDHGTLSGHRDLQKACADEGITPILGVEAYISPTDRFDKRPMSKRESESTQIYNHIILLAKNQIGVENINAMSRIAWTEGFYHKPRIDREILYQYNEGVIVLSGCLNGIPAKAIANEQPEVAVQFLQELADYFGDDAYVEVQGHNPYEINHGLIDAAKQVGLECVATSDCHYAYGHDRALEDALLILSTKPSQAAGQDYNTTKGMDLMERLNALYPDRTMTFKDWNLFVDSRKSIQEQFLDQYITDDSIYDNTLAIAEKVEPYKYYEGLDLLPSEFDDPNAELERRVFAGLKAKGVDKPEYYDCVQEEMRVIRAKNFAPYFLVVQDATDFAHRNGILVGPGRGSAAGSVICYALDITDVDPVEYDLLFARFINEERNDYPDIDVDFEDSRRGEVKEYMRKKYGHVGNIATYTYFKSKSALKDAARVLGVPFAAVNGAMKQVPNDATIDGIEYYENYSPRYKSEDEYAKDKLWQFKQDYPDVLELAKQLDGRIRGSGMHAGGMVISSLPIEDFAPIETKNDPDETVSGRVPVIAYDKNVTEDIGLIKMDFLGLSTLSVIARTLELMAKDGININYREIPLDDQQVYDSIAAGKTVGIFQFDQPASTKLAKRLKVANFEDTVISTSLVRPGAMETVGEPLLRRKHGEEDITYVHEIMRKHLEKSYGVIVYQEQVMQAAVDLGGMSWSKADKLRKIIGKKLDKSEFAPYMDAWMEGATKHIDRDDAEQLWHDFEAHAGYSFNRSHAVAYSMITIRAAWLKVNYPLYYMTALLDNEGEQKNITRFLIEAKQLGIPVVLPHISKSESGWTVQDGKMVIGLSAVKWISDKVAYKILSGGPYDSYADFVEHASKKGSGINKRAIEALNAVGAASFKDNPRTGDEPSNYYTYIGIPKFDTIDLPESVADLVTDIDQYEETDGAVYIIAGQVSGIKSGKKGNRSWTRVEVMDETGTAGLFNSMDGTPEEGQFYYMLVAGASIVDCLTARQMKETIADGATTPLGRYLTEDPNTLIDGQGAFVVKFTSRRTKAGAMMGDLIIADSKRQLHHLLVFPGVYNNNHMRIKEGRTILCSAKNLDDGGKMLMAVK